MLKWVCCWWQSPGGEKSKQLVSGDKTGERKRVLKWVCCWWQNPSGEKSKRLVWGDKTGERKRESAQMGLLVMAGPKHLKNGLVSFCNLEMQIA